MPLRSFLLAKKKYSDYPPVLPRRRRSSCGETVSSKPQDNTTNAAVHSAAEQGQKEAILDSATESKDEMRSTASR